METTELKVVAMTWGFCAASVTKALKREPGVDNVNVQVDLPSGIARITGEHSGRALSRSTAAAAIDWLA
ncbi:Copper chaperone [Variovorax sp. HW608]|uniref:heavy-metal-associated domain-containing protein n=1 Tax=Variovorax sp. HW608 TaxID=1034889 RepID=UPI00081FB6D9|nr:heavy-metal-associated domain-containing protein [Variovorax sp. HW608]SCK20478.1 Copper chaperone [Variovorax sp. HW608]